MLSQDSFNVFPHDFFAQESAIVARALLGHQLLRRWPDGTYSRYRIVETEAYTQDDPACHAYGKSPAKAGRSATLFKAPGMAYVYLIYGIYHCLNVVTEPEGRAGAVLFRALEPLAPFSPMQGLDGFCTRGPGKLCNALQITKAEYNEKSMMSPDSDLLLVQATQPVLPAFIQASPRIGIRQAQAVLWRFFEINNPWVSSPPGSRYRAQGKLF